VAVTDKPDWQRLAEAIVKRRRKLVLRQADLHPRGGPSAKTLGLIESASVTSIKPHTKRGIEMALGWAHGDVDRILAGGEPTPVVEDADAPRTEVLDERPGERLLIDIVAGVGNLSDERRREILTLIRAMQQPDSPQ